MPFPPFIVLRVSLPPRVRPPCACFACQTSTVTLLEPRMQSALFISWVVFPARQLCKGYKPHPPPSLRGMWLILKINLSSNFQKKWKAKKVKRDTTPRPWGVAKKNRFLINTRFSATVSSHFFLCSLGSLQQPFRFTLLEGRYGLLVNSCCRDWISKDSRKRRSCPVRNFISLFLRGLKFMVCSAV